MDYDFEHGAQEDFADEPEGMDADLDFAHYNPPERTRKEDLDAIKKHQRTLESLEQRFAEERFARGRAVRYCPGKGRPVYVCRNLEDLQAAQLMTRDIPWK